MLCTSQNTQPFRGSLNKIGSASLVQLLGRT